MADKFNTRICTQCKGEFKIPAKRGRPPVKCPSCKDSGKLKPKRAKTTEKANKEEGPNIVYRKEYKLLNSNGSFKPEDRALWVGSLYRDEQKNIKYGKEVRVKEVEGEQVTVEVIGRKGTFTTKLSNLNNYEVHKVVVNPAEA